MNVLLPEFSVFYNDNTSKYTFHLFKIKIPFTQDELIYIHSTRCHCRKNWVVQNTTCPRFLYMAMIQSKEVFLCDKEKVVLLCFQKYTLKLHFELHLHFALFKVVEKSKVTSKE